MHSSSGNSSLRLIGCGCAVLVVLVASFVVGMTWFAYSQAKNLSQGFTDPETRAENTREILRYETLPAGYHPAGAFSIPFLFKTAILSDKQELTPGVEGESSADLFDERGFFYVETPGFGRQGREIEDYFEEGSGADDEQIGVEVGDDQTGVDIGFDVHDVLDRGKVPIHLGQARYVVRRGTLEIEGEERPGLSTLFHLDCDNDSRVRFGMWFSVVEGMEPEPVDAEPVDAEAVPESPAEAGPGMSTFDFTGTPADPHALEDFLGHFEICG